MTKDFGVKKENGSQKGKVEKSFMQMNLGLFPTVFLSF